MHHRWKLFLAAGLAMFLLLGCGVVLFLTDEPELPLPRWLWDVARTRG